jgi:hypothetical protein
MGEGKGEQIPSSNTFQTKNSFLLATELQRRKYKKMGRQWGKGFMCIKDWFLSLFPLFVT